MTEEEEFRHAEERAMQWIERIHPDNLRRMLHTGQTKYPVGSPGPGGEMKSIDLTQHIKDYLEYLDILDAEESARMIVQEAHYQQTGYGRFS